MKSTSDKERKKVTGEKQKWNVIAMYSFMDAFMSLLMTMLMLMAIHAGFNTIAFNDVTLHSTCHWN